MTLVSKSNIALICCFWAYKLVKRENKENVNTNLIYEIIFAHKKGKIEYNNIFLSNKLLLLFYKLNF